MTAQHEIPGIRRDVYAGLGYAYVQGGPSDSAYPPVLLLHGWGAQIEAMTALAEALHTRGFRTHVLDFPGFGRSDPPPEAWGVADYAAFVLDYIARHITAQGAATLNLIGHSFGGRISIVLGAEQPARIGKIVLTDSAGVIAPPTARDVLVKVGSAALKLPVLNLFEKRLRTWGRSQLGSDDLQAAGTLEPTFRKVIAEDLLPRAALIKAPTLLIWGDQDTDTPLWQGQLLEKTIPDAGLVVFQGARHFAYQERLPDFVRIVETFFKG